jgi:chaperonin GroEL (HSP60 family)
VTAVARRHHIRLRPREARGTPGETLRGRRLAEAGRLEGDERSGAHILHRALEAPARQIAENSGKVVRLALENAVSVGGVLLLTEATMTEVPETKPERETVGAEAGL